MGSRSRSQHLAASHGCRRRQTRASERYRSDEAARGNRPLKLFERRGRRKMTLLRGQVAERRQSGANRAIIAGSSTTT